MPVVEETPELESELQAKADLSVIERDTGNLRDAVEPVGKAVSMEVEGIGSLAKVLLIGKIGIKGPDQFRVVSPIVHKKRAQRFIQESLGLRCAEER